ncbi:MAG: hypothetical protein ABIQ11_00810 [Saprospiraceae bacterium]
MKNNESKDEIISLKRLFIYITIGWISSPIVTILIFQNLDKMASFGDSFGTINSLFSGLALAGIIYTIFLQKTELSLQREELKLTRTELKRAADAHEQTLNNLKEENRIKYFPYFQYKSLEIDNKLTFLIYNESPNPALDFHYSMNNKIEHHCP